MLEFSGSYFDGKTSKAHAVQAVVAGGTLRLAGDDLKLEFPITQVEIEPVLGRTRRVLKLGAARLETADLEVIAALERSLGRNAGMTLVNHLERRWGFVLLSFVALIVVILGVLSFGLPWLAERAAAATPTSVIGAITDQTFELLKTQWLKPSKLADSERQRVAALFARVTRDIGGNYPYRLELHASPLLGANALALPSGVVIVTDEFVRLSRNDAEILGVLAHEIGHVTRRHALRQLYQSLGVFALASIVIGDFASLTNIAAGLPTILLQSGYSRQAETEADEIGGRYLIAQGLGTKPLRDILERLTAQRGDSTPGLLRSHPGTEERLRHLAALERAGR